MQRLLKAISGLWAVLAVALVATLSIGHSQPPPIRLAQLHLADCKIPCWSGLIFGQTRAKDVEQRMGKVLAIENYHLTIEGGVPKANFILSIEDNAGQVKDVEGTFTFINKSIILSGVSIPNEPDYYKSEDFMPKLDDVVSLFGAPSCFWEGPNGKGHLYFFLSGDVTMNVEFNNDPLWMTRPVRAMEFNWYHRTSDGCRAWNALPWRGFINISRYLAKP